MAVRIVHPDLAGQVVTVLDERALVIYERSGWRLEGGQEPPKPAAEPLFVPPGHVVICHPVTKAEVAIPAESVDPYRASGWMLKTEHEANLADAATRAAADRTSKAAKAAASTKE